MKNSISLQLCMALCSVFAVSCSHLTPEGSPEKYTLELKALEKTPNQSFQHYIRSVNQQVKDRSFATEQESELRLWEKRRFLPEKSTDKRLAFAVEVSKQEGEGDLHDFAFPRVGEVLQITYTPQGGVLHAGGHPKDSIFFLPLLPLPNRPVGIGDTWTAQSRWVAEDTGFPFLIDVVAIFKSTEDCGDSRCARLEISGNSSLEQAIPGDSSFEGELQGQVLFDIGKGKIYSTSMTSRERLVVPDVLIRVATCIASQEEQGYTDTERLSCEPPAFEDLKPAN